MPEGAWWSLTLMAGRARRGRERQEAGSGLHAPKAGACAASTRQSANVQNAGSMEKPL
jgi:hypothetical protein